MLGSLDKVELPAVCYWVIQLGLKKSPGQSKPEQVKPSQIKRSQINERQQEPCEALG